ncbi:MAG: AraC family transcriptional regulator [Gemmatimonas sp.]
MSIVKSDADVDDRIIAVSDVRCRERRSGAGAERQVPHHELVFVRRGVFVTHVGRQLLTADSNHVVCVSGGTPVRFSHPTEDGDTFTKIELPPAVARDLVTRYLPRLADALECPLPLACVAVTPALILKFHQLRAAFRDPISGGLAVDEAALQLVHDVVHVAHAMRGRLPIAVRAGTRRSRADLVESTKLVIAAIPNAPLSLATLAHTAGSSPFHLAHVFRDEVGVPIHRYRLQLRLALALDRIAEGEDNLSALGHELGFTSHSHFTRAFRAAYGQPPNQIRKRFASGRVV